MHIPGYTIFFIIIFYYWVTELVLMISFKWYSEWTDSLKVRVDSEKVPK